MKNFKKYIFASCLGVFTLTTTGCLEETFPTDDYATTEQIQASPSAAEALIWALPAKFNELWNSRHNAFGYGAQMQIRDQMTQDLFEGGDNGYTWWSAYARNQYLGDGYINSQYIWNYHYGCILAANTAAQSVDIENCTEGQKGMYGAALAFRALFYLDAARMFEFLPTDGVSSVNKDGNDVTGLTIPIVNEHTTQDEARNNPRATHAEMAAFIEDDLNQAEEYISFLPGNFKSSPTIPDLACVYGLKARLYMWNEDYAKAKEYARKAIAASRVRPMSESDCLNVNTGFNDISKWMWGATQSSETSTVQTGIINWTSWLSNQTEFGYTGIATGMFVCIDKSVYDRIADTDFRKLWFVAPAGSALDGKNKYPASLAGMESFFEPYAALKFRPNEGNTVDYNTGASSSYPVMRVEEMYFIEAEAAAHLNAGEGVSLINDFMKTYRDASYNCSASDIVEEIVFQKRIEFWGEGQTYFDIKRLDMPVVRGYEGHNRVDNLELLNTTRRPAWMNIVMVQTEQNNNKGVLGWNSPDPSDCYTPWEN